MDHNYTIMTTGKFSEANELVEHNKLALFAFADIDSKRTAWLTDLAESDEPVKYEHGSGVMLGYLELVKPGDVSLFHFHLAETR